MFTPATRIMGMSLKRALRITWCFAKQKPSVRAEQQALIVFPILLNSLYTSGPPPAPVPRARSCSSSGHARLFRRGGLFGRLDMDMREAAFALELAEVVDGVAFPRSEHGAQGLREHRCGFNRDPDGPRERGSPDPQPPRVRKQGDGLMGVGSVVCLPDFRELAASLAAIASR